MIGLGLTGVEVASEVAEAWPALRVSLLGSSLLPGISDGGRRYARVALAALGVEVIEGAEVRAVTADAVELAGGARRPSAVTVWAGGFGGSAPAVASDWPLDARGRIVVDADLGVSGGSGVFAAGADPAGRRRTRSSSRARSRRSRRGSRGRR